MTRRRHLGIATVLAGVAMVGATPAAAHGIGGRTDLPLPAWQLAWAAGFAVASSFVA
ncbi:MAG: fenitrothion hydrolase, partial [Acidimicrobiaceae bacterium]|nr:fenitrothion hydrolase [Acidimicrobiaceae bacterium]